MSVFDDVKAIEELESAGQAEQIRGEKIANAGRTSADSARRYRLEVEAGRLSIQDAGERARRALEDLNARVADQGEVAPVEQPKPTRKRRSKALAVMPGDVETAPRVQKPHASEGRKSPLTDDLRAKLTATLAHGPMQLPEIEKMSWTVGRDVEALLCEDPDAFVSWRLDDATIWGTWEQFMRACSADISLKKLSDHQSDIDTVVHRMGCAPSYARRAILEANAP